MNIGQAAAVSGISAKMLRYYDQIGLAAPSARSEAGYRVYTDADVNTLRFIRRARAFGLSMERIRLLVGLWRDRSRPSREVKRIANEHVAELRAKIAELTAMCDALEHLADSCRGDQRPECPILDKLADAPTRVRAPHAAAPKARTRRPKALPPPVEASRPPPRHR